VYSAEIFAQPLSALRSYHRICIDEVTSNAFIHTVSLINGRPFLCFSRTNSRFSSSAAAMALQPVSGLSLLYALPPGFSVFGFGFPSSYAK
jgi:hypothetical protein